MHEKCLPSQDISNTTSTRLTHEAAEKANGTLFLTDQKSEEAGISHKNRSVKSHILPSSGEPRGPALRRPRLGRGALTFFRRPSGMQILLPRRRSLRVRGRRGLSWRPNREAAHVAGRECAGKVGPTCARHSRRSEKFPARHVVSAVRPQRKHRYATAGLNERVREG